MTIEEIKTKYQTDATKAGANTDLRGLLQKERALESKMAKAADDLRKICREIGKVDPRNEKADFRRICEGMAFN